MNQFRPINLSCKILIITFTIAWGDEFRLTVKANATAETSWSESGCEIQQSPLLIY